MTKLLILEIRRIGIRLGILPGVLLLLLSGGAWAAGELVDYSAVAFELIYPLFVAVAVSEWCPVINDPAYDLIYVEAKSLARWIARRFLVVYVPLTALSVPIIFLVSATRAESTSFHSPVMSIVPSFLLSALAIKINSSRASRHTSSMIVSVLWLSMLIMKTFFQERGCRIFDVFYVFNGGRDWTEYLTNRIFMTFLGILLFAALFIRLLPKPGIRRLIEDRSPRSS